MTEKMQGLRELTDAEVDLVSGGGPPFHPFVLIEGNGNCNFNSNAPNTPGANNGLQQPKDNGAFVGICIE